MNSDFISDFITPFPASIDYVVLQKIAGYFSCNMPPFLSNKTRIIRENDTNTSRDARKIMKMVICCEDGGRRDRCPPEKEEGRC